MGAEPQRCPQPPAPPSPRSLSPGSFAWPPLQRGRGSPNFHSQSLKRLAEPLTTALHSRARAGKTVQQGVARGGAPIGECCQRPLASAFAPLPSDIGLPTGRVSYFHRSRTGGRCLRGYPTEYPEALATLIWKASGVSMKGVNHSFGFPSTTWQLKGKHCERGGDSLRY